MGKTNISSPVANSAGLALVVGGGVAGGYGAIHLNRLAVEGDKFLRAMQTPKAIEPFMTKFHEAGNEVTDWALDAVRHMEKINIPHAGTLQKVPVAGRIFHAADQALNVGVLAERLGQLDLEKLSRTGVGFMTETTKMSNAVTHDAIMGSAFLDRLQTSNVKRNILLAGAGIAALVLGGYLMFNANFTIGAEK